MQDYQNGEFGAKVKDWGIKDTKGGKPQAFVVLDVEFPDSGNFYTKPMTWYGSFNAGKAMEITLKALMTCGLKGNDPSIIADGPEAKGLELGKPLRVVIVQERSYTDDTKMVYKIAWINSTEGGSAIKRMPAAEAKAKLANLNLGGEMARLKSTMQVENEKPKVEDDDIPF